MNIPEYQGEPLSVMSRITQEDAPEHLWHYTYKLTPLPNNLDTINRLTEQGYEQVDGESDVEKGNLIACLVSQLHDVVGVRDGDRANVWAHRKSIEYVKKYPVLLCFTLKDDEHPDTTHIQMLQFLPLPRYGEYAVIGVKDATLYNARDLDESAQQLKTQLGRTILDLAGKSLPGESQWMTFTQSHADCASELQYLAMRADLQANLLASRGKKRQETQSNLEKLEKAHYEVVTLRQSWLRPDWLHQWQEIRRMAQELAAKYYERFKAQQQKPLSQEKSIANVFSSGIADMLTALPFQAYPAATIAGPDGWKETTTDKEHEVVLSFQFRKPSVGSAYVEMRGDATGLTRDAVLAKLWEQVKKLSDLDADVYLAMVAQMLKGIQDEDGNTWISAQQILNYRGIVPKMNKTASDGRHIAGHRLEDMEDIAYCVARMEAAHIKLEEMEIIDNSAETKGRRKPKRSISREARLFMFGDTLYHNELSLDGTSRSIAIAWQYRRSTWMLPFLEGPNPFIGTLIQKTLMYDPYHEMWEKRLARFFTFWLRTNASRQKKPNLTIGNLLIELNLPINERRPERTRARFHKAMDRLVEDEQIIWEYTDDTDVPARNWLATWLQKEIKVEGSQIIKNQYLPIETTAKILREKNKQFSTKRPQKRGQKKGSRQ